MHNVIVLTDMHLGLPTNKKAYIVFTMRRSAISINGNSFHSPVFLSVYRTCTVCQNDLENRHFSNREATAPVSATMCYNGTRFVSPKIMIRSFARSFSDSFAFLVVMPRHVA